MSGAIPPSREEIITQQFYDWEKRGRGWSVWPHPVELEPPFQPFWFHYTPRTAVDDGRRSTFLSSIRDKLLGRTRSGDIPAPKEERTEPDPNPADHERDIIELSVTLPPKQEVRREAIEHFLEALAFLRSPLSFEVIGTSDSVRIQFACAAGESKRVHQQLSAYFPEAIVREEPHVLEQAWNKASGERVVVDFGLSHEFMLPLRTVRNFDVDPLIALTAALSELDVGEVGVFQVLFQSANRPWPESVIRAVSDADGKAFFADAPQLFSGAKEKIARPLFSAVVRIGVATREWERTIEIAQSIGGTLSQFRDPLGNEFIPLHNDEYPDDEHEAALLGRYSHRSGMLLNLDELLSLAHLPSASVRLEKLQRQIQKTKIAPAIAHSQGILLGHNTHNGKTSEVRLSPEQRVRHTYVIGGSGTGKSTLLLNLILQDIKNGEGVGVLDPHGDLIEEILGRIPEHRIDDVVLVDPADEEYPVGFNILSAHSEIEKNLIASDMVGVFRRFSTSWGDQMTSVLGNAVLAMLESKDGGTLADLRRFLVEKEFREQFLTTVTDPEIVYYWQKEFPLLVGRPQASLLTRLDTFLRPKLIRHMVTQKHSLDFSAIMNKRKIFLAKLSQGAIGEENSYLLGSFIVSKFHQMAMGRQELNASSRTPFYLYLDEFHNFITPSLASILSAARKYQLGLILAHQDLKQLWNRDTDVANAVISNPYTRVCFRLGDFDAQKLKDGFSLFDGADLQNLGTGEAIVRMERSDHDFNLKTEKLVSIDPVLASAVRERVVQGSRNRYGTPRVEVGIEVQAPQPQPRTAKTITAQPVAEKEPVARPESLIPVAKPSQEILGTKESTPGKGGNEHKRLQHLIKRLAEDRGFKATIEYAVIGATGSVDVALQKNQYKIACEITISTTVEHEIQNARKCLAAGFDQVVMIAADKRSLTKLRSAFAALIDESTLQSILFLLPEDVVTFLDQVAASQQTQKQTVKGYTVKVNYRAVAAEENTTIRRALAEILTNAVRKSKH